MLKKILISLTLVLTVLATILALWVYDLDQDIQQKLQNKKILAPTEYYSAPETYFLNQTLSKQNLIDIFNKSQYRERGPEQTLLQGDYIFLSAQDCVNFITFEAVEILNYCTLWKTKELSQLQLVLFDQESKIIKAYTSQTDTKNFTETNTIHFEPISFAQYIGKEPIFQRYTELGDTPPSCLNGVMAIEDYKFLDHQGVNPTSIARAFIANLLSSGPKQGGSTITQQMVKNYFLTSERTFKRKFYEFFMSLILELRASKDEIFETYLNIIYLGQNGPFQVRGFGAAAEYYFNKPLHQLETHECALLSAVLNSPGLYNPFTKPENALKRRNLVIKKMYEHKFITEEESIVATAQSLPKFTRLNLFETAPYFIEAVNSQIKELGLNIEGKKIYTTLDLKAQSAAQKSVQNHIQYLETQNKTVKKLKEEKNNLEGLLVSAHTTSGHITAVVGGRSFRQTQFNRAIDGHRQIGSIMKPLVFLTALLNQNQDGEPYQPMTLIKDEIFTHKYEGQKWTPHNYNKKYYGDIPMYYALKHSLNAATARLGLDVGLDKIIENANKVGIQSKLDPVPSLTLGAFELYPLEVLSMYLTFANFGTHKKLTTVISVREQSSKILFEYEPQNEIIFEPSIVAELVGMMKQTMTSGTAASSKNLGYDRPSAGKTGTTSDYKDSWFAGFSPHNVTVTWVGYDNNLTHNLSGSSGALPIWVDFMKNYEQNLDPTDFTLPENVEVEKFQTTINVDKEEVLDETELYLRNM